jgi:GntR family transcriptional regulator
MILNLFQAVESCYNIPALWNKSKGRRIAMRETLSLKIYNDIYDKIKSCFYKPDEQLPTENALKDEYRVSLAPIRQALGTLETEGLIIRKPGKGTFVAKAIQKESMVAMGGFGLHFIKCKHALTCRMIECEKVPLTPAIADSLHLPAGTIVTRVSRVRLVKKEPIFLLNHYIPGLDPDIVRAAGPILSMREFLKDQGFDTAYVLEKIKAIVTDDQLSKLFKLPVNYPLLKIKRLSYDKNYKPLCYGEYYVKSDTWDYQIQFNTDEFHKFCNTND